MRATQAVDIVFFTSPKTSNGSSEQAPVTDLLNAIAAVIEERRTADPDTSYVASLNQKGLDKILEKVGEEAIEVILAAKTLDSSGGSNQAVISEVADLVFHSMVMLDRLGISHNEVLDALALRQGMSGLEEKASRNHSSGKNAHNDYKR